MLGKLRCKEIERAGIEVEVMAQREEILKAFIAKYGCDPDEIEQVQQNSLSEIRWCVRRRVSENRNADSANNKHIRIRKCPCCNGATVVARDNTIFSGQNYSDRYSKSVAEQNHGYMVRCGKCGLQTCWWHYEEEAIAKWNNRPKIRNQKLTSHNSSNTK